MREIASSLSLRPYDLSCGFFEVLADDFQGVKQSTWATRAVDSAVALAEVSKSPEATRAASLRGEKPTLKNMPALTLQPRATQRKRP
jgi:hypothetical protein